MTDSELLAAILDELRALREDVARLTNPAIIVNPSRTEYATTEEVDIAARHVAVRERARRIDALQPPSVPCDLCGCETSNPQSRNGLEHLCEDCAKGLP